ncbi:hypothetical protein TgHK011_002887 [Trichoderma gracile]|nr:hypothetical protein TgHK011_002887 [Trichoderma gracile]
MVLKASFSSLDQYIDLPTSLKRRRDGNADDETSNHSVKSPCCDQATNSDMAEAFCPSSFGDFEAGPGSHVHLPSEL